MHWHGSKQLATYEHSNCLLMLQHQPNNISVPLSSHIYNRVFDTSRHTWVSVWRHCCCTLSHRSASRCLGQRRCCTTRGRHPHARSASSCRQWGTCSITSAFGWHSWTWVMLIQCLQLHNAYTLLSCCHQGLQCVIIGWYLLHRLFNHQTVLDRYFCPTNEMIVLAELLDFLLCHLTVLKVTLKHKCRSRSLILFRNHDILTRKLRLH